MSTFKKIAILVFRSNFTCKVIYWINGADASKSTSSVFYYFLYIIQLKDYILRKKQTLEAKLRLWNTFFLTRLIFLVFILYYIDLKNTMGKYWKINFISAVCRHRIPRKIKFKYILRAMYMCTKKKNYCMSCMSWS